MSLIEKFNEFLLDVTLSFFLFPALLNNIDFPCTNNLAEIFLYHQILL